MNFLKYLTFLLLGVNIPSTLLHGSIKLLNESDETENIVVVSPTCQHCCSLLLESLEYYLIRANSNDIKFPKILVINTSNTEELCLKFISFFDEDRPVEEQKAFLDILRAQSENGRSADETISMVDDIFGNQSVDIKKSRKLYDLHNQLVKKHHSKSVPFLVSNGILFEKYTIPDLFEPELSKPVLISQISEVDLGEVIPDQLIKRSFIVKNNGNATAYLTESNLGFPNSSIKFDDIILEESKSTSAHVEWIPNKEFTGLMTFKSIYRSRQDDRSRFEITVVANRFINGWSVHLEDTYLTVDDLSKSTLRILSQTNKHLKGIQIEDNIPFFDVELVKDTTGDNKFLINFLSVNDESTSNLLNELRLLSNPFYIKIQDNNHITTLNINILKPQPQSKFIQTLVDMTPN